MTDRIAIKRALISVSDKTGVVELGKELEEMGVEIISTGGTLKTLKDAGVHVVSVSSFTGAPEIMGGRVKTLHPKIHGGRLANRDDETHQQAMNENEIDGIDLVVVNLYPFTEVMRDGGDYDSCIENIDIGGPAMFRASAMNHDYVTVLTVPQDYEVVIIVVDERDGATT